MCGKLLKPGPDLENHKLTCTLRKIVCKTCEYETFPNLEEDLTHSCEQYLKAQIDKFKEESIRTNLIHGNLALQKLRCPKGTALEP